MAKASNVYVVDFETLNSKEAIEQKYSYVWLWDLCKVSNLKHTTGTTIEEMFELIDNKNDTMVIYSHNLKFDGSFILNHLLKYCTYTSEKAKLPLQLSCIIDDKKNYYEITYINKKSRKITFRDSAKKIPSTVEQIAKAWHLPILKGSIDYRLHRPIGWKPTDEEISYIHNDTEIIARVLQLLYAEGMTKLTASSDSFNAYKSWLGKDNFEILFPVFDIETDNFCRKSYQGGCCYANPKYLGKELHNVYCYDVNSMYPYAMAECMLPYGKPLKKFGKPKYDELYPLYITHIRVGMRVKQDLMPTIMKKGLYFSLKNEYITDTENQLIDLYITNIDYETMLKHYDIYYIEYFECYYFKASNKLLKDYILELYEIKNNSEGAMKNLAKIKLNSLYGKFAMNPKRSIVEPKLIEGQLKLVIVDEIIGNPIYTPMAVFIASYCRNKLFKAIQDNYEYFVYCDTDSIHTIGKAKGIEIDDKKLGAWKEEKHYTLFKCIAQKTYYGETDTNKRILKACGAPQSVKDTISYDEFEIGRQFGGKLRPVQVEGGVILVDTTFTFKER